jgi:hypothetical protein
MTTHKTLIEKKLEPYIKKESIRGTESYITGVLVNPCDYDLSLVSVRFQLYGEDEKIIIGLADDSMSVIPAGKQWIFKASVRAQYSTFLLDKIEHWIGIERYRNALII